MGKNRELQPPSDFVYRNRFSMTVLRSFSRFLDLQRVVLDSKGISLLIKWQELFRDPTSRGVGPLREALTKAEI